MINSTGVLTEEIIDAYEPAAEERAFLERSKGMGYASIIGPSGQVLTAPMGEGEGILYADVDLNDVLIPKLIADFAGHYNRPDVFSVHVNTSVPPPLIRGHAETGNPETENRESPQGKAASISFTEQAVDNSFAEAALKVLGPYVPRGK